MSCIARELVDHLLSFFQRVQNIAVLWAALCEPVQHCLGLCKVHACHLRVVQAGFNPASIQKRYCMNHSVGERIGVAQSHFAKHGVGSLHEDQSLATRMHEIKSQPIVRFDEARSAMARTLFLSEFIMVSFIAIAFWQRKRPSRAALAPGANDRPIALLGSRAMASLARKFFKIGIAICNFAGDSIGF